MRTNIDIDERLLAKAMKATGAKTRREVVNTALEHVARNEAFYRNLWRGEAGRTRAGPMGRRRSGASTHKSR